MGISPAGRQGLRHTPRRAEGESVLRLVHLGAVILQSRVERVTVSIHQVRFRYFVQCSKDLPTKSVLELLDRLNCIRQ